MSEPLYSKLRYNFPKPLERCTCWDCDYDARKCREENDIAPFRMGLKIPFVKSNFLMELDDGVSSCPLGFAFLANTF